LDDEVWVEVTLNFDSDPAAPLDKNIQGWSYAICLKEPEKLELLYCVPCPRDEITYPNPDDDEVYQECLADPESEYNVCHSQRATLDGTDTGTVFNDGPPAFDLITFIYDGDGPEAQGLGWSKAVVIDFMSKVTLKKTNPERSDWQDMKAKVRIKMDTEGDEAHLVACSGQIGEPPVAAVMVVSGGSISGCTYDGLDPADPESGCTDPAICNTPGTVRFSAGLKFIPGNANGDTRFDLADPIWLLRYLYPKPGDPVLADSEWCPAAADFNGDGSLDASDAIAGILYVLQPDMPPDYPLPLPDGWPKALWQAGGPDDCQTVDKGTAAPLTCDVPQC
jgi:hypothetical protein